MITTTLNGQTQEPPQEQSTENAKFIASGSRINDHTLTESLVPIDVIRGTELKQMV